MSLAFHNLLKERLRFVLSIAGVALIFGERLGGVPLVSMLAILVGAASLAEANIVAKRLPHCHPVANNAIGMGVGAVLLLGLTLVSGESLAVPVRPSTLVALGYLALVGSVVVFTLYLVVIQRWTAGRLYAAAKSRSHLSRRSDFSSTPRSCQPIDALTCCRICSRSPGRAF